MKVLLQLALALITLWALSIVTRADGPERQAVVYCNEACDECMIYVEGELADIMTAYQISLIKKDYINQRIVVKMMLNWIAPEFITQRRQERKDQP